MKVTFNINFHTVWGQKLCIVGSLPVSYTHLNLEASTRQLNTMLSKDVPGIMSDLKVITGNFNEVSTSLKGLDLATTVNSINATLANLQLTTDKLNQKDNTLGLLLNDRSLYNNLDSTCLLYTSSAE